MFLNDYYHGGGVITIEVSENVNIRRNIENLRSIKMAPSFGSVDSLIEIPLYMSYWGNSDNDLQLLGISDRLVRISIGCEPIKYILSDIKRLLKV